MKGILFFCFVGSFIFVFILLNFIGAVATLGYVIEEKRRQENRPPRKSLEERVETFWKKFWRKILKVK